jgi:hypothetical protein
MRPPRAAGTRGHWSGQAPGQLLLRRRLRMTRRARNASGTATQCTRRNDSGQAPAQLLPRRRLGRKQAADHLHAPLPRRRRQPPEHSGRGVLVSWAGRFCQLSGAFLSVERARRGQGGGRGCQLSATIGPRVSPPQLRAADADVTPERSLHDPAPPTILARRPRGVAAARGAIRRHRRLLLTRRAHNASGTATQCTRSNDSRAAAPSAAPPSPPSRAARPPAAGRA